MGVPSDSGGAPGSGSTAKWSAFRLSTTSISADEATQVGDAVLTAWSARLPEPNLAADRIAIEVGG